MSTSCCLGIDTSNYKTSVAIVDSEGKIICNLQKYLNVKKGERGLRQSDALFQHVMNLPKLIEEAFSKLPNDCKIECVSVSSRPRPVEGSYMPVFNAGITVGSAIASSHRISLYTFSHQEGHIKAVKHYSKMKDTTRFISFHFSGGTTEALLVDNGKIKIIGGSKDLAYGQVIDRTGVYLGLDFPCGMELDRWPHLDVPKKDNQLPIIKSNDGFVNLSGIETKVKRLIESDAIDEKLLVSMLFDRISKSIKDICNDINKKYQIKDFIFAGGVSSSEKIRSYLRENLTGYNLVFGDPSLSSDNAVGIALLGGNEIWH